MVADGQADVAAGEGFAVAGEAPVEVWGETNVARVRDLLGEVGGVLVNAVALVWRFMTTGRLPGTLGFARNPVTPLPNLTSVTISRTSRARAAIDAGPGVR